MAKYYQFTINAQSPIRISDDSVSQSGQTDTLTFIPGSTFRGLLISKIASDNKLEGENKKTLFSDDVCFLNAYLTVDEKALFPSPKGFYEDKSVVDGEKNIENVVIKGDFTDGLKRASLGKYCVFEPSEKHSGERTVKYYSVETGSDLKIKIKFKDVDDKQSLFRIKYMAEGQSFRGAIRLSEKNDEVNNLIKEIFAEGKTIFIGNGRSSGLGKCLIKDTTESECTPFLDDKTDIAGSCYMMLLSDTTMRDENGEYCGLNLDELEKSLGVSGLEIAYASTGMRNVRGYNRTLGSKLPSVPMYAAGSVFHIKYDGTIKAEVIKKLCDEGIGIRRNEGYGRVVFFSNNFEDISSKTPGSYNANESESNEEKLSVSEMETLKAVAKGYYKRLLDDALKAYVTKKKLPADGVSAGRLGTIRALLIRNRYYPNDAKKVLKDYFKHAGEKEASRNIQKEKASLKKVEKYVNNIFEDKLQEILFEENSPLKEKDKVMGIDTRELFTEEDEMKYKVKLLIEMLRFTGKER